MVSDCVATNSETVNQVHLEDIDKYLGTVVTTEQLFDMLDRNEL